MPDTFDDLAAIADLQPQADRQRYGRMLVKAPSSYWGFPGAPIDGTNLRVPRPCASDARVKAAIAAGAWFAFEVDADQRPTKAMPADSIFAGRPPLQPHEVGTARALPPVRTSFAVYRGGTLIPAGASGVWTEAWRQGEVADPTGCNLPRRHLVLETDAVLPVEASYAPQAGDILRVTGANFYDFAVPSSRYVVESFRALDAGRNAIVLKRFLPSGVTG